MLRKSTTDPRVRRSNPIRGAAGQKQRETRERQGGPLAAGGVGIGDEQDQREAGAAREDGGTRGDGQIRSEAEKAPGILGVTKPNRVA